MKTLTFISLLLFSLGLKGQENSAPISKQEEISRDQTEFANYNIGDTVVFTYKTGFVSQSQELKYSSNECRAKGIITEKDSNKLLVNVLLVDGCDRKGIIAYNKNLFLRNRTTGEFEKADKQIIYMLPGKKLWFKYSDWENQKR
jgi:hypothetical protein